MKYLTQYEKYDFRKKGTWIYFKLIVDKSFEKLKIAIEKTGYSDLFYKSFDNLDEELSSTMEFIDFIYLVFNPTGDSGRIPCNLYLSDEEFISKYENIEYKGEITVEDHEIDAKKYNL